MWLSTVAIVALVIVAIIAALILIILLTPITYSIEINGRSPYRGEVRVKWLWRVFSLHLAYLQDKPFFKELYILGMLKIGPVKDYEEWLENRVDEEYQKVVDEDDEMSQTEAFAKAMQGGGQGPSASSSGTSFEDLKSSQRSDATFGDEESPGLVDLKIQMNALNVLNKLLRIWMHRLELIGMTPFSKIQHPILKAMTKQ